jgi:general secretion pathway protein J
MKKTRLNNRFFSKGFTLLELLIAIAVFAVMSAMAYGGLSNVILISTHSEAALERMQVIQHTMTVITRDLTQISPRGIRDEFGNAQPYLTTSNFDFLLEFTRSGRRNPAQLKRSNLLRVAYKYQDNILTRLYWPQLDRVQGIDPYETALLDAVTNVELRYLDASNEWKTEWPPSGTSSGSTAPPGPPVAIEFKIELEDWGEITRIFRVNA